MQPRYQIAHNTNIWASNSYENGVNSAKIFQIPYDGNKYFVDILDQTSMSYKIRMALPSGQVITGWVNGKVMECLSIFNTQELFDGRFNSDRI